MQNSMSLSEDMMINNPYLKYFDPSIKESCMQVV